MLTAVLPEWSAEMKTGCLSTARSLQLNFGRSTRIRTLDPLVPNQVRYRAALHSEERDNTRIPILINSKIRVLRRYFFCSVSLRNPERSRTAGECLIRPDIRRIHHFLQRELDGNLSRHETVSDTCASVPGIQKCMRTAMNERMEKQRERCGLP